MTKTNAGIKKDNFGMDVDPQTVFSCPSYNLV